MARPYTADEKGRMLRAILAGRSPGLWAAGWPEALGEVIGSGLRRIGSGFCQGLGLALGLVVVLKVATRFFHN